ncbi:MAG: TIGR01548 family HAD-type hydrolase [Deltaproteobacteria bacterium]|nr:TIGR01548 family HAD-type hydrolase [Deltaproteobacteria bacterium]MCB9788030.1 TIGR01548 family HAD-type hydrolase [Deltaproteobacteria bacterium]
MSAAADSPTPGPAPSPAIAGLVPYRVPRHPAPVDLVLDGNEGQRPSPSVWAPLASADPELARRYPKATALEKVLAEVYSLTPEEVLVTSGGDDALDRAARSLLAPGRELILPVPTFEMIGRYATLVGAEVREVPWPRGAFPTDAVIAEVTDATAAIAVVTPNNPTGAVASAEDLRRLSAAAPRAMLLVDLAYGEFADEELTSVALTLPNAIVFRTLSKAWGLAGLRIGYALGPARYVGWLRAAGNPYAVSAPSVLLGCRQVAEGHEAMRRFVDRIRTERAELFAQLTDLGVDALPSQGNFVFGRTPRAAWLRDGLAGLGIGVRVWPGHPELDGACRITCPGDPDDAARLSRALRATLAPEALIFDMDGVLADVSGSYRRAIIETAMSFGVTLDHDAIARAKARGNANNDWVLTRELMAARGVEASLEDVTRRFEALYQGEGDTPGLRSTERLLGGRPLLERLAHRLDLAVVTGRPRRDAVRFLEEQGIADLFGAVVCMEDGPAKPDPTVVRAALSQLGVRSAWMVGDTPDDIRSARAAGVVPIGVIAPGEDAGLVEASLYATGAARVLTGLAALEEMLP